MSKEQRVVMIAGNGFDEVEVKVPMEYLPKNGIELDLATLYRTADVPIEGKKGYRIEPTVHVSDLKPENYDAVLLPGGHEGPDRVRGNETVIKFVQDMNASGKIVAAICHGPWVLCTAEILHGKKATCYPAMKADLVHAGAIYVSENVVADGNLITADRPETSEAWCNKIVEVLHKKQE
ncbi:MAG: DJ-1/PfpI/YhbO family deglycase/protease [Patescibacteria group bacterium]